jgi:protein ImuB
MKRIVAIVASRLACEIAREKVRAAERAEGERPAPRGPFAVILEPDGGGSAAIEAATLDVVDDEARRLGVRPGQKVTEAAALAAHLQVHRVTYAEVDAALGRIAEVALSFAPTAAICLRPPREGIRVEPIRAPWGDAPFDTVWLDITGAAHLAGGEEALLDELLERVRALGHSASAAIASGPRIAQALARWAPTLAGTPGARATGRHPIALPREGARAMAALPVHALPLEPDTVSFLVRLGLMTVGDLAKMPPAAAQARLGARAREVLDIATGRDDLPLTPYAPPRVIVEEMSFEDGVETAPELLFVLRGMTSRVATRLAARGEACTRLEVSLQLDQSVAALRLAERGEDVNPDDGEIGLGFHVDLPAPLSDEADLLRALRAKLERTDLFAPAVGLKLTVPQIVEARRVQIDLGQRRAVDPDRLPALLAELSADIGAERVGVLSVLDAHRPEARSRLRPLSVGSTAHGVQLKFPGEWSDKARIDAAMEPLRLLPEPVELGRVAAGTVVAIDQQLFTVEKLRFVMRLDRVEWWNPGGPVTRDYVRAFLTSGDGPGRVERLRSIEAAPGTRSAKASGAAGEALLYFDRKTREAYLQGWCE